MIRWLFILCFFLFWPIVKSRKKFSFEFIFLLSATFPAKFVPFPSILSPQNHLHHITMVENGKKHGQNSHLINHCPTREWAKWASERMSERSGGRERSKQSGASERVSDASKWANRRASGPVLTSRFLFVPDHSVLAVSELTVSALALKIVIFRKEQGRSP